MTILREGYFTVRATVIKDPCVGAGQGPRLVQVLCDANDKLGKCKMNLLFKICTFIECLHQIYNSTSWKMYHCKNYFISNTIHKMYQYYTYLCYSYTQNIKTVLSETFILYPVHLSLWR